MSARTPRHTRSLPALNPLLAAALLVAVGGAGLVLAGHGLAVLLLLATATASVPVLCLAAASRGLRRQICAVGALAETGASLEEDPDAPLRCFLLAAQALTGFERGIAWMENDAGSGLQPRAALGPDPDAGATDPMEPDPLVLQALVRPGPFLMPRVDSAVARVTSARTESWILCPIRLRGRSIGVAQLIAPAGKPFRRQQALMLEPLAGVAAVAFEAACGRRLIHRYADLAEVDGLTGIANRRRMVTLLGAEAERASRYGHSLTVMMLDIDEFKAFNDRYGHPQGDRLIQAIARILRSGVRRVDHVGRYGGEEFIIVLPETGSEAAYALAERLRAAVEAEGFDTGSGSVIRKTVSIGIASFPAQAASADELVQRADDALYRAKRAGRNRVLTA